MFKKYAEIPLDTVLDLIKKDESNKIQLPFNTLINGNHYYVTIDYDLGGFNVFTDENVQRGYYLGIQKGGIGESGGETEMFGGLRECINTVKRQSKKQARISNKIWGEYFSGLVNSLIQAKKQREFL